MQIEGKKKVTNGEKKKELIRTQQTSLFSKIKTELIFYFTI